jgi:hypothetical protein
MNKLEPFTRYDCEQDCSGYELGRAYMSECEIGDYVLYADAQAREAALVEALRDMMGTPGYFDWLNARAILAQIDAEKGGAK